MIVITLLQCFALIFLSLSMHKHFNVIFNKKTTTLITNIFQITGWLLMIISFITATCIDVISLVYWLNLLSLEIILLAIIYCAINKQKT